MLDTEEKKDIEEPAVDRASWGSSFEFILSLLGYAVGMTNVLRFPYVCMKNGGGAFLIPYFCSILICGMPMMFLEMVMGQNLQTGCISCWDHYSPVLKGVGYGMMLISGACTLYYQTYYTWIIYYIYQSFSWDLPWASCGNAWNTEACVSSISSNSTNAYHPVNHTLMSENDTMDFNVTKRISSVEEFFHHHILGMSDSIENVGNLQPRLVVAHVIGWIAIYLCVCKGVKSVGKVVYVSATAPYLLLVIFLIRAALLPGSFDGIMFFITPDFQALANAEIWLQAFVQIFFSFGLAWGGIITMASYNKYNYPVHRAAIAIPIVSSLTSLLCGFLVFSVAGFLAHQTGAKIDEAVSTGPGLAFITYPEAAAHFPGAPIWAILFFLMLILTGADSQFVTFETCVSAFTDELKISRKYHVYFITGTTLIAMVMGLIFLCSAGMYIFQIVDWYIAVAGCFIFGMIECLAMVWIYGYRRLFNDLRNMIGFEPIRFVLIPLWGVVIPLIIAISMIWCLVNLSPPKYGSYTYPWWINLVGWPMAFSLVIPLPIVAIYRFYKTEAPSVLQKFHRTLFPEPIQDPEKCHQLEAFL